MGEKIRYQIFLKWFYLSTNVLFQRLSINYRFSDNHSEEKFMLRNFSNFSMIQDALDSKCVFESIQ